ncbi:hypothetical protein Tco_0972193 [Tanacetum coccineum]
MARRESGAYLAVWRNPWLVFAVRIGGVCWSGEGDMLSACGFVLGVIVVRAQGAVGAVICRERIGEREILGGSSWVEYGSSVG